MILQKKTLKNFIQTSHNDYLYRTLIIGDSESGKVNLLFNLISH